MLREFVHRANRGFNVWLATEQEVSMAFKIVESARQVAPIVCSLPGNEGKEGFALVLSKNEEVYPPCIVQVGNVTDPDSEYGEDGKLGTYVMFAGLKSQVLRRHPGFICSSQNLILPNDERLKSNGHDIPGGALVFGDWIISVSAFKNPGMDTAAALAIAVRSGLISENEAVKMAKDERVNCKEFLEHKDKLLKI